MPRMILTDAQWALMEPHCLGKPSSSGRVGGDARRFMEAVLWIALTVSPHTARPAIKQFTAHDPVAKWTCAQAWRRATAHNARRFLDKLQADMPFPNGAWRYEFYTSWDLPDDNLDHVNRWIDAFADEFNTFRPHQALGGHTPAEYLARHTAEEPPPSHMS